MQRPLPLLGVDIGRVLINGDGPDTSFLAGTDESALRVPAMTGAFDALGRLCRLFDGRVWLVSKCGPRIEARTRRWLDRHRFFQTTGIPYGHLRFCRERKDKAPICRALGASIFVDDRRDVLDAMIGIVPHRLQFGAPAAPSRHGEGAGRDPALPIDGRDARLSLHGQESVGAPAGIVPVPTWREAEEVIVATLRG